MSIVDKIKKLFLSSLEYEHEKIHEVENERLVVNETKIRFKKVDFDAVSEEIGFNIPFEIRELYSLNDDLNEYLIHRGDAFNLCCLDKQNLEEYSYFLQGNGIVFADFISGFVASLSIKSGEVVVLLGENDIDKSKVYTVEQFCREVIK